MHWRWGLADPSDFAQPNANPAAVGTFTYGPRFPGQFFDGRLHLHYDVSWTTTRASVGMSKVSRLGLVEG